MSALDLPAPDVRVRPSVPGRDPVTADARVAALVVALWALAPLAGESARLRPAITITAAVLAVVRLGRTTRHTGGRERTGWALAFAGATGALLPVVGSVAGILFGAGLLLIAGGGWLSDRHRLLDGAIAATTLGAATVAYLLPRVLELDGVRRFDGLAAALQLLVASTAVLGMSYRCRPRQRPDVWLVAGGFIAVTLAGLPGLLDLHIDHASAWLPTRWWECAVPLAALAVAAGAELRCRRPEASLESLGTGSEPNAALVGDLCLGALVLALVLAPPAHPAAAVALLVAAVGLRHARGRRIEHDNARLARAAAESAAQRLALYRASFVALSSAIEARDGYTGRHSEETVDLVARVARALELPDEEVSEIKTSALLHDVGKIGIPDGVLHKTGPLDADEWTVMRRHPEIGERILAGVPGLERIARAVRHEHERWDGCGYPDGISGEQIPLASRIVLVCDAFHAMTSDRPYRSRMGDADAVAELRRCAGTQFDPAVVEALASRVLWPSTTSAAGPPPS